MQTELDEETRKKDYCEAWLETAKLFLTHPRFVKLPGDIFEELLETVANELEFDDEESPCLEDFEDDENAE